MAIWAVVWRCADQSVGWTNILFVILYPSPVYKPIQFNNLSY